MATGNILVVDDEKLIRWSLKECLQEEGYEVAEAEDGRSVLDRIEHENFDVILLDYRLPDMSGIDVLHALRKTGTETAVVMITAHSSVDNAVEAMQAGASDYVGKPFRNEDILLRVGNAVETWRLRNELKRLRREQWERFGLQSIIGSSPAMQKVFQLVERVLESRDTTILVQGESGTGKDVLAKAIHFGGPRSSGPYTNITCTALPETLLESELFGHEKGAFTDAKVQKKGLVELATGGTMFLDEIGDMTGYLQGKILRFLEEKTFRRVGGQKDLRVDVRIIAATNRDLKKLVDEGKFREDLYFRLKVIPIQLPPLREREGDIPLLVQHFTEVYNREFKKKVKGIAPSLLRRFEEYHWPGNVRELKNAIERAMILGTSDQLDAEDIPIALFDEPESPGDDASGVVLTKRGVRLEDVERDLVVQALRLAHGNQTRAGRLLGLNRDQIRYRVEKFGLHALKHPDENPGGEIR